MRPRLTISFLGCILLLTGWAWTAPVDFNTFTAVQYNKPGGFDQDAQWNVDVGDSSRVSQASSQNATASIYHSPDIGVNTRITGRIVNTGPDDDYIGFVLGFSANEHLDNDADYILIDWRANSQTNNFNGPGIGGAEIHDDTNPSGGNDVGLALSLVTGRPTADEFWHHEDYDAPMVGAGGVNEQVRGTTLGSTGYGQNANDSHDFQIDWLPGQVDVFVDGVLEISYTGTIPTDGTFGLYQMFQQGVDFEAFEYIVIPEPESGWLMALFAAAYGGFLFLRRKP